MTKSANSKTLSPSAQLITERCSQLKINKTELAREMGVSTDYIYRILRGRVPVPNVRETLERFAGILQIPVESFEEYRLQEQAIGPSVKLIWKRIKELNITREELFEKLEGRISRPYFNSIMRGDQPFPSNRAFIQLFASAVKLLPSTFSEYGPVEQVYPDVELKQTQENIYEWLFLNYLKQKGYRATAPELELFEPLIPTLFNPSPEWHPILKQMGELGMTITDLSKVSGLQPEVFKQQFKGEKTDPTIIQVISKSIAC
jgi:hypothetical protein